MKTTLTAVIAKGFSSYLLWPIYAKPLPAKERKRLKERDGRQPLSLRELTGDRGQWEGPILTTAKRRSSLAVSYTSQLPCWNSLIWLPESIPYGTELFNQCRKPHPLQLTYSHQRAEVPLPVYYRLVHLSARKPCYADLFMPVLMLL